MSRSSNITTPNLGMEPFGSTSPEFSQLTSPLSELESWPDNDEEQTKAIVSGQTTTGSHDSPLRRSTRERKPTPKLGQPKQRSAASVSPKRRKTGAERWMSSAADLTATCDGSKIASDPGTNAEHLQPRIRVSSLLKSREPSDDKFSIEDRLVSNSAPAPHPKLVERPRVTEKADIERDLQNAFFSKVQGRVHQSIYGDEDRESYFDKFRPAKNRIDIKGHAAWKEETFWPAFDANNPTYYDANGKVVTTSSDGEKAGSNQGSEAPSPSLKGSRFGQSGKNGKHSGRGGNKANKGRGAGGRDRDSPEPPGKPILDQDERLTLAHVRQRQVELKKFFSLVGGQQKDALEIMTSRELSRLHKKSKYHTKVPEYQEVMRDLQNKEGDIIDLIDEQYTKELHLAHMELAAEETVLASQFQQRVEESQREHIQGAQGDLVIFRKAHLTAKDETRTNNGSDIEPYFPRYHELPEADAGPRGFTSTHIQDEKPFKEHLASYDDQANQEVIDDDIVAPVVQSVAEENARRQVDEERKARFDALITITREELRQERGYLIPRPRSPAENPQFALSRLADCAEYISRKNPEKEYIFMPLGPAEVETLPLDHLERVSVPSKADGSRPSTSASQRRPSSAKKPLVKREKSLSLSVRRPDEEELQSQQPSDATSLPLIAPAPTRKPSLSANVQQPVTFPHMPPPPTANVPPSPTQGASRRSSLAPLLISRPPSAASPPTPSIAQSPASIPPPPSPSRFGGPLYPSPFPTMLGQSHPPPRPGYPFSQQPYHPAQPPPPPRFERPPVQQSVDFKPPVSQPMNIQHRFPTTTTPLSRPRVGGPRREPGQITFTPAQTPDSERFKNPPQPQPLPPGQAVYRPSSLQQLNSAKNTSPSVNNPVPPEPNSRSQQAADVARQTASINQGQGAGPKGGRRILLPKRY